jgi:hypothetical protein
MSSYLPSIEFAAWARCAAFERIATQELVEVDRRKRSVQFATDIGGGQIEVKRTPTTI